MLSPSQFVFSLPMNNLSSKLCSPAECLIPAEHSGDPSADLGPARQACSSSLCLVPVFEIPHLTLSWFTLSFYRPDPRKLTKGCMGNCYWDFFYVLECLWSLLSFTNRIQDWKSFSFRFSKLSSSFLQPLLRRFLFLHFNLFFNFGGWNFLYSFDNCFSLVFFLKCFLVVCCSSETCLFLFSTLFLPAFEILPRLYLLSLWSALFFFSNMYLFIWLHCVLVAECGL